MSTLYPYPFLALACLAALLATGFDLRRGEIPNWLTGGAALSGLLLHAALGWSEAGFDSAWRGAAFAALGVALCASAPFVSFRLRAIGGGDLKLFAAIGAICGPVLGIQVQLCALLLLAIYCFSKLAYRGKLLRMLGYGLFLLVRPLFKRMREAPLAPELLMSVRAAPAVLLGLIMAAVLQVA
jgi:prepilin peptidase CpaA